jgi:peroxiredoxin Q/BCP
MTEIMIGKPVADFEATATGNQALKLTDFSGKYLILYFYPKDNTPGCIKEGQEFRDHYAQFQALDAEILGISRDSVKVHENFKAKQQFPFHLLSDKEETLCQQFDVIKMKNMYGKQVRGIERSTFLISKKGVLLQAWRKVKIKTHIEEVLQALKVVEHSG